MEKEKRKGRPRRRWIIAGVLTISLLLIAAGRWAWSYYIIPGHSLSEFSRFETEEEVVAFLHEHFDPNVTTSADIRTFIAAYTLESDGCENGLGYSNGEVTNIIRCGVATRGYFLGNSKGYLLTFYMGSNDLLVDLRVRRYCNCL